MLQSLNNAQFAVGVFDASLTVMDFTLYIKTNVKEVLNWFCDWHHYFLIVKLPQMGEETTPVLKDIGVRLGKDQQNAVSILSNKTNAAIGLFAVNQYVEYYG